MTRAERAAEAARLLDEGLNGVQIAKRLGISRSYAYALINDPTGDGDRKRKERYGRPCIEGCGRFTSGSDGRANAPLRCIQCLHSLNEERDARILEAWERGETGEQIAAREGLTYGQVQGTVDHARRFKGKAVSLHRRRNRELWPLLERRWNEGVPVREIAAEAGITPENAYFMLGAMRKAGLGLPERAVGGRRRVAA